jgi:hypothetical protein
MKQLAAIRDAVSELQGEGMAITLDVRSGAYKCPISFSSSAKVSANGTVRVGGTEIDFAITRSGGSLQFSAYLGQMNADSLYLHDSSDLKAKVTDIILNAGAKQALLDEFNLDVTGRPGLATGKAISIAPPLKLKNTPKP